MCVSEVEIGANVPEVVKRHATDKYIFNTLRLCLLFAYSLVLVLSRKALMYLIYGDWQYGHILL